MTNINLEISTIDADNVRLETVCPLCGQKWGVTMEREKAEKGLEELQTKLIQDVFPDMAASDRELFITGTCPKCWKDMFGLPE